MYDVCPCLFACLCPCVWRSEDKVVESSLSSLGTAPQLRFNGESRPNCSVLLSQMLSQQAFRIGRISLRKHDSALLMRVDPCNLQHNLITHKFTSVTHRNTHTHSHTHAHMCIYACTHMHTCTHTCILSHIIMHAESVITPDFLHILGLWICLWDISIPLQSQSLSPCPGFSDEA